MNVFHRLKTKSPKRKMKVKTCVSQASNKLMKCSGVVQCTDCKDRKAGRSRRITDRLKELNITLRGREEAFPGAVPSEYVQEANNGVN